MEPAYVPDDTELDRLAAQVDEQFTALRAASPRAATFHRGGPADEKTLPSAPEQEAVIERATGEKFETFWQRYLGQAREDLCVPGGILHDQWEKWRDFESKVVVRTSYVWLAAMGVPTGSLAPVAVAATVFLLNAAANIGIKTVCEGCPGAGEPDPKPPVG